MWAPGHPPVDLRASKQTSPTVRFTRGPLSRRAVLFYGGSAARPQPFSPMSTPGAPLSSAYPYATHLNVLFNPLEKIALDPLIAEVRDAWYNQTLARVNESVVRLGVMHGEYHWHEHANDDELFFVLEGRFLIDLDPQADGLTPRRVVTLEPREGFVVPKGVRHRTRAPERAVILMIETASIVPTGD